MPEGLFEVGVGDEGPFPVSLWALFASNRLSKDHVTASYPHTGFTLRRCSRSWPLGAHKIKTVLLDGAACAHWRSNFQILSQATAVWGGVL